MNQRAGRDNVVDLDRRFEVQGDASFDRRTWSKPQQSWDQLLEHPYVVVLGEGGMGKSTELREQARRRSEAGEFGLFVELTALAESGLENAIDFDAATRLGTWRDSDRPGVFFLDSLDEAKLHRKTLKQALNALSRALGNHWPRARLVISSRDSDWIAEDRRTVEDQIPPSTDLLVVQLSPLDRARFERLARSKGITDFEEFWAVIEHRDALAFTGRPADASWLAAYWAKHRKLTDLTGLIENVIEERCVEPPHRELPLSLTKCKQGLRALCGVAVLQQRWSFHVPGSEIEPEQRAACIDTEAALADWMQTDRLALLRLPIFDEASYGRVRVHHRFVHEYLAAKWLDELLDAGWPYAELDALLFRRTALGTAVPDHLRAVAAWLAPKRAELCDRLITEAPEVLIEHGDPAQLSDSQRQRTLEAFVGRYADRQVRNQWFSRSSLRRFACESLAPLVSQRVLDRTQALELRMRLLDLIESGPLPACVATALQVVRDADETTELRVHAIAAIGAAGSSVDRRALLQAIPQGARPELVGAAIQALGVGALTPEDLADLSLRASQPSSERYNEIQSAWNRLLEPASDSQRLAWLAALTARLRALLAPSRADESRSDRAASQPGEPAKAPASDTDATLDAATLGELTWALSLLSTIAARIIADHTVSPWPTAVEDALELLRQANHQPPRYWEAHDVENALRSAPQLRRHLFWAGVRARCEGELTIDAAKQLPHRFELWTMGEGDAEWLTQDVQSDRPIAERLVAFDKLYNILHDGDKFDTIAQCHPVLTHRLQETRASNERLKAEFAKHEYSYAEEQQRAAENQRRYLEHLRENESSLRDGSNLDLLGELYSAAGRNGASTVELSKRYGTWVAEAAEQGWRAMWRKHNPKLPHESATPNLRRTVDLMGLAGITLEVQAGADLSQWSFADAVLAARYAALELNRFPEWFEALSAAHPQAVREALEPLIRAAYAAPGGSLLGAIIDHVINAKVAAQGVLAPVLAAHLHESDPGSAEVLSSLLDFFAEHPNHAPTWSLSTFRNRCNKYRSRPRHSRTLEHDYGHRRPRRRNQRHKQNVAFFATWMRYWLEIDASLAIDYLLAARPSERRRTRRTRTDTSASWAKNTIFEILTLIEKGLRGRINYSPTRLLDSLAKSPLTLQRLLLLAFTHVHPKEDLIHQGAYFPTERDYAQDARHRVLNLATDLEHGLPATDLRRLADEPCMNSARELLLNCAERRAALDAMKEDPWAVATILELYRDHGTAALDLYRSLRPNASSPRAPTPEEVLEHLCCVSEALVDRAPSLRSAEDPINDWLLELLRQRLSGADVEVGDQARGGLSGARSAGKPGSGSAEASGGVGERDAVLRHQGRYLGIIEAFRVHGAERQPISTHLQKLPAYNLVGVPCYVIVYYQKRAFDDFSKEYPSFVGELGPSDWPVRSQDPVAVRSKSNALRAFRFEHDAPRGTQQVFHLLVDLSLAPSGPRDDAEATRAPSKSKRRRSTAKE